MAEHHQNGTAMEHREETMKSYTIVFAALMVLLALTVLVYYIDLGPTANLIIAMIIAVIKAAMVLMVFMHVRLSPKLVWVFATGAFLWLALMIAFFHQDYDTRHWDDADLHGQLAPEASGVATEHHG